MRHSVPPLRGSWGKPLTDCVLWEEGGTEERKGVVGQRGRGRPGKGGRQMKTRARLEVAWKALLFNISLKTRWQAEQGEGKTRTQWFLWNTCSAMAATATRPLPPPPAPLRSSTPIPHPLQKKKKRKIQEENKCFLFLFLTGSQQFHKSSLCIFTQSEIWIHTTAINFHCLQLWTLPRYVAQRGFLWAGLQLPGSHLHKEEILVHSVYLFCVEKSRAINHEEIHSTLFHFTLLSTTLYRVSEWIFNIMPQNALVFYHMLGLYQSDNTWEFWEILSTEGNSFKV